MELLDAAVAVLREEGGPLHWTVIQDRALRAGYVDPFTQPDVRKAVLAALREGVRTGRLAKTGKGEYSLADRDP